MDMHAVISAFKQGKIFVGPGCNSMRSFNRQNGPETIQSACISFLLAGFKHCVKTFLKILLALYFSFKLEQHVMGDDLHLHEEHIPSSLKARAEADKDE